jgi:hypothetical protein
MSLITVCEIFCSLKFHTVCTCTFFGDTIWLPTNRKMIKIVTLITVYRNALIDSHILFTYDCLHCFSVSNIWVSHALEMTIFLYYPTHGLFFFSFTQPFTYSKFCLPAFLFSLPPPAINNDRSLSSSNIFTCRFLNVFQNQIFHIFKPSSNIF